MPRFSPGARPSTPDGHKDRSGARAALFGLLIAIALATAAMLRGPPRAASSKEHEAHADENAERADIKTSDEAAPARSKVAPAVGTGGPIAGQRGWGATNARSSRSLAAPDPLRKDAPDVGGGALPLTDPPGREGHPDGHDEAALGDMHVRWKEMARGCYEQAAARRPGLKGKVAFQSVIVGDPNVGGIVESTELKDAGTLDDRELLTCLRESILTLPFPPPRDGNWYRFNFPANFEGDAALEQE